MKYPPFLEVKDRLFEDKDKNLLYIAMFNRKRQFTAYAVTDLHNKALVEESMPFHMVVKRRNSGDTKYAQSVNGISLHEIIFGEKAPPGYQIDHENWDGLDNRRANLRLVTCGENSHNQRKREGTTSEYFGVCLWEGKWIAKIRHDGESYNLGKYDDEEEAAKVHDVYAVHFYKDKARINIKDGEYFLSTEEIEDIYKNGIPAQYKLKKRGEGRELPECIGLTVEDIIIKKDMMAIGIENLLPHKKKLKKV